MVKKLSKIIIVSLLVSLQGCNKNISDELQTLPANIDFYNQDILNSKMDGSILDNYRGIAIKRDIVGKFNVSESSEKFCDNTYCYYNLSLSVLGVGQGYRTGSYTYSANKAIDSTYTIEQKDYYGWSYSQIPFNSSESSFAVNCFAIDCNLLNIKYYGKWYLLLNINDKAKYSGLVRLY